jgi:cobalt/nickel transport system permease protein
MHIEEGVLAASPTGLAILAGGAVLAAAGTAFGLRRIDYERVPQVGMLSAAFFVASLVHVPMGFTSVHLVLNGLVGLLLGWAAFPAILVALFLQSVFFGFGGLTTLGVNTVTMAVPAVVVGCLFSGAVRAKGDAVAALASFSAGALGVLLGLVIWAAAMIGAQAAFRPLGQAMVRDPLAVLGIVGLLTAMAAIEGLVTASAVVFLRKVRPELLELPLVPAHLEVRDA